MRSIRNLRRVKSGLLFEIQDFRYVASYRMRCPQLPEWPAIALATLLPTTVTSSYSSAQLQSYFEHITQLDDVCRTEFLAYILVDEFHTAKPASEAVHNLASSYSSKILPLTPRVDSSYLAFGPYLIAEGSLWQVFRLYDDVQGAFMVAVDPTNSNVTEKRVYAPLMISGLQYQTLSIAVPSRIAKISGRPLENMRIVVKDMFELNGLTTTLCNRAFYETNKPSTSTAACVKKLVNLGAQILGTAEISSMISREEPAEAVDYHPPFNPRADGYQSPAGSSSGSGVAAAAYEWLDFAIAEDTSGGGRRPAAANGVFQYRPTHDLVDLNGMWPTFLQFDTPVIISRDLNTIASVAPLWCNLETVRPFSKPISVLYPDDYLPIHNKEHLLYLDSFVKDLSSACNGTVTRFSIAQKWSESCPDGCSPDIREYLNKVIVQTFYYCFYHSQASFRDRYYDKHQKKPFVNSFVRWRWDMGSSVTEYEHREGLHRLNVYKSWLLKEVMNGPEDESVLVIPISEGEPNYRDRVPGKPTVQHGFDSLFLSPILGCPDLVVPIAQMEYWSNVSGQEERLPICANVLMKPGADSTLIDVVRHTLKATGRPCAVKTGAEMF